MFQEIHNAAELGYMVDYAICYGHGGIPCFILGNIIIVQGT